MYALYLLKGSLWKKCGNNLEKIGRFSMRTWPDWGKTAWADMAGLGSIEFEPKYYIMIDIRTADVGLLQWRKSLSIFKVGNDFHIDAYGTKGFPRCLDFFGNSEQKIVTSTDFFGVHTQL